MRTKWVQFCCWPAVTGVQTRKPRDRTRQRRADIYLLLELEPKTDLRMPRRIQRARHLPEGGIAKGSIREIEARGVGKVKEFSSHLKPHPFADDEFLADG